MISNLEAYVITYKEKPLKSRIYYKINHATGALTQILGGTYNLKKLSLNELKELYKDYEIIRIYGNNEKINKIEYTRK